MHAHIGAIRRPVAPVGARRRVSPWGEDRLGIDTWIRFRSKVVLLLVPVAPIGYLNLMNRDERHRQRIPFGGQESAA